MIAIGKIVVQVCGLAKQPSARGASVAIDHLLLHRVLDEVALVLGAVALRQELGRLLRGAISAIHLAQLHRRGDARGAGLTQLERERSHLSPRSAALEPDQAHTDRTAPRRAALRVAARRGRVRARVRRDEPICRWTVENVGA